MLETLKARKEQLEAQGKKGFTLMEMLIVIAIIAILIAIAIPIFSSQLDNAKAATDEANIRSGYAEATATILTADPSPAANTTYYLKKDGSLGTLAATGTADDDAYKLQVAKQNVQIGSSSISLAVDSYVTYVYNGSSVSIKIVTEQPKKAS